MKPRLSIRLLALGMALGAVGAAGVLVAAAYAGTSSASRLLAPKGAVVALRKTALGPILVDSRGRTLYLFAKDRNGMSACNTACATYWPALTSHGVPRAGTGVQKSMLKVTKQADGVRQVTYAGHPLYTFVGDKSSGQTAGEGLNNFGAGWYVLAASGQKVEQSPANTSAGSSGSSGYGSGGYAAVGSGW
jgi:predicted lipoprotein with Yx(FWY)xxD motif